MDEKEECICLKGKICCKCGKILEKEDLKPKTDPFAEDMCDDHSEHLICYECACILASEV